MTRASLLRIAALVLPLLGLGWTWASSERLSRQGTDWQVPIEGFDPRDLLRGHYVEFRYDWPVPRAGHVFGHPSALCLEGRAPIITAAQRVDSEAVCPNLAKADGDGVYGYDELERGRLYTSQAEAARLQEELWDPKQQGVLHFRLRPDGHITPLRLTFRPRPPGEARDDDAADPPAPLIVPKS